MVTLLQKLLDGTYMCWPVLYPQITGGAVLPGDVVVKVSYRQSPINGPSVVVQVGLEEEPPQVNGGESSSVSKSSLSVVMLSSILQMVY